jgi:sugar-specific transcriptional regulator TrmB/DNA-binding CsgD family transcriptional regulator
VAVLDELGLTERQEVIYVALVDRPGANLDQLARRSGMGRNSVARTLTQLSRRGLAIRAPGRETRYTAVAPAIALETLLRHRAERLDEVRRTITALGERFEIASRLDGAQEMVEVVHGNTAVHSRWLQLQRSARSVIRVFDKPPYIDPGNPAEQSILSKGVAYRTVYDRAALDVPGKLAGIWEAHAAGEDCRVAPNLPLKLFIADERMALAPLRESVDIESAIVVHASALLSALVALFETVWTGAVPLQEHRMRPDGEGQITDVQAKLLDLLDMGLTDEAIARHLGLGYRTVQRRISQLMELYGAHTRFQLGVQTTRAQQQSGTPSRG